MEIDKDNKHVSVQSALGMLVNGLFPLLNESERENISITIPLAEYERLKREASKEYKARMVGDFEVETLFWKRKYRDASMRIDELKNEVKRLQEEIRRLNKKSRKWWQIW